MQSNKLRMAIRSTAAVAILGVAAQANAISFETGGYETSIYGYARLNASYDIDSDQALSTRWRWQSLSQQMIEILTFIQ